MQSMHLDIHIEQYLKNHNLTSRKLGIGYSGGVDSTALVISLMKLYEQGRITYCPLAIYIRHGLRPRIETQQEEELLIRNTIQLSVPLIILEGKIEDLGSFTSETDARTYRFGLFQRVLDSNRIETILTAHHQDDDLEFQLLRISQGNGWKSFLGISDDRPYFAKPLLSVSKVALEQYVREQGFGISTDSTNESARIQRNVIRNTLLPIWYTSNPQLFSGFQNNKAKSHLLQEFLADQLTQFSWKSELFQVSTTLPEKELHPYLMYELILQGIQALETPRNSIPELHWAYEVFEPYGKFRETRRSRISLDFLKPIMYQPKSAKIQGHGIEIEKKPKKLTIKSYLAYSLESGYSFRIESDTCISTHHGTYIGYKLLTEQVLKRGPNSHELIEFWLPLNLVRCSSYTRTKKQEPNENKLSIFTYKGKTIGYLCKNNQGVVNFIPTKDYDMFNDETCMFGFIPYTYGDEK